MVKLLNLALAACVLVIGCAPSTTRRAAAADQSPVRSNPNPAQGASDPEFKGRKLSAWLDDLFNYGLGMHNPRPEVVQRSQAATAAFREMGTNVLPALMAVMRQRETDAPLESPRYWRRMQAAHAIAIFGTEAKGVIPELIELMKGETNEMPVEAWAFDGMGAVALIPLSQALTNSDQRLHRGAADALAVVCARLTGDRLLTNAIPALTTALLQDKDVRVRESVAGTMWSVRQPEGMPALVAALSDPDSNVRGAVLNALDYTYEPNSPEAMLAVLKRVRDTDSDERVRLQAGRLFDKASQWPPKKTKGP